MTRVAILVFNGGKQIIIVLILIFSILPCINQNRLSARSKNDQWDQVIGACGAGAFLNRDKGPSGMIQGAATYGLFSLVFASQTKPDELDVVDVPVNPTEKRA